MSQDFSKFVEIGILQQRKIEAEIVKPIYEIMKREFGLEKAKTIIEEAVANAALEAGKEYAKREPNGTSVESFAALQYLWEKDDALRIEVLDNTHEKYSYTYGGLFLRSGCLPQECCHCCGVLGQEQISSLPYPYC